MLFINFGSMYLRSDFIVSIKVGEFWSSTQEARVFTYTIYGLDPTTSLVGRQYATAKERDDAIKELMECLDAGVFDV